MLTDILSNSLEPFTKVLPLATGIAVACRMMPIALLLPLGNNGLGWKTKASLGLLLTILVTPLQFEAGLVSGMLIADEVVLPPLEFLFSEAVIGLAIGTAILFVVESTLMGGQWIGMTAGVPLKTTRSELGNTSLGMLVSLVAGASLLMTGLHQGVLTGLLDSYRWLPANDLPILRNPGVWIEHVAIVATWSFTLALRIAMPVMVVFITLNLTVGWLSRHTTTFNHFVVGIPLNTLVLLGVVILTMGSTMLALQTEIESVLSLLGVL